jgi:hypothetical protein
MTSRYLATLFSDRVKAAQADLGSRAAYARHDGGAGAPDRLGEAEAAFIAARDSFYLASTGNDGWPYLQHRGGPPGFLRVLDPATLAFADFRGNRQYISLGNIAADDRVALFLMDYANRARLKILARMSAHPGEGPLAEAVALPGHGGRVERVMVLRLEAFDWNCPQHITPRFTLAEIEPALAALRARIADLEAAAAAR